ncbi:MAG: hypothetical protein IKY98_02135, partial [Alphaproteobacteria bacterium]|nr:hypothetical protein [Alphaproteobacteria bacterium]
YSCTHGICMSEEVPGFETGFSLTCNTDAGCNECQYCYNASRCENKNNGILCEGGSCQDGLCIAENTCTNHSECEKGFFCDTSLTPNQCVKTEFVKIHLSEIDRTVYVSKRNGLWNNLNLEPKLFCELNGFDLITKDEFMSDAFFNEFSQKMVFNSPFNVSGGYVCFSRLHDKKCEQTNNPDGYTICVDSGSAWSEP